MYYTNSYNNYQAQIPSYYPNQAQQQQAYVPAYDTSNFVATTTKPRSKTWDRIKSLTKSNHKNRQTPPQMCTHYHPTQGAYPTYVHIPRYRDQSFDASYVNPYYCPPNQYHIHSRHSQVNLFEKLYPSHKDNRQQRPVKNNYGHQKQAIKLHKPKPRPIIKQHNQNYEYLSSSDLFKPKRMDNMHGQQSRSKSQAQIKLKKQARSSSNASLGDFEATTTATAAKNVAENISDDIPGAGGTAMKVNVPVPPPAPPINEDIFKPMDSLVFAKKNKIGLMPGVQTEQTFNAVVSELKSRLNAIRINKEKLGCVSSGGGGDEKVVGKEKTSAVSMPILNKVGNCMEKKATGNGENESLLQILQDGRSKLKPVGVEVANRNGISNPTLQDPQNDQKTPSFHSIYTSNPPLFEPISSPVQSQATTNRHWLNSTFSDSANKLLSKSSTTSTTSTETNSSLLSSTNSTNSTNSQRTNSIRNTTGYKLEVYNDDDQNDVSDDYTNNTNVTRMMLSPTPTPTSTHTPKPNPTFCPDQKKITAFCTNNLFRGSKNLRGSNYIRIAESYNSSPGFIRESEDNSNYDGSGLSVSSPTLNCHGSYGSNFTKRMSTGGKSCLANKIEEYLNDMSDYYRNLQTNCQFRS